MAANPGDFGINPTTQAVLYPQQQQQQQLPPFGQPGTQQQQRQQPQQQQFYPMACPPPFRHYPTTRTPHPPSVVTPAPTYDYSTNPARAQRVFSLTDLPTRRDLAEAFQHVQTAAKQTTNLGRRDVIELQLLEHFVETWDRVCTGLSPRAKLRVYDRVRLLYHVAQGGWTAALEGYADPSATLLLGAPPTRQSRPRRRDSPPGTPPRPNTRAAKKATTPTKKGKKVTGSSTIPSPGGLRSQQLLLQRTPVTLDWVCVCRKATWQ
ncbi:hypothetical protein HPB47_021481 [Ixodes persulcatus]|uniref:Uncharacterized protein n=1 Tax=Ixodes persulcatus TaxID=34615 RepID=A0AC60QCD1_IXOPE|nr:hypothetical protein HPB47_021481 [Ixodes persulcatus]